MNIKNMGMTFGKHRGELVELVVLKDAQYIRWMLTTPPNSQDFHLAVQEAQRLIEIFDAKPFLEKCRGRGCSKPATRCSVHKSNIQPVWWCEECDPYQQGAFPGNLQILRTYHGALWHIRSYCDGRKADMNWLIRSLAEAKGLPGYVDSARAEEFFKLPRVKAKAVAEGGSSRQCAQPLFCCFTDDAPEELQPKIAC